MYGLRLQWRELVSLFWAFLRIGPLSFGGGFAMLPVMEREIVQKRSWISQEELGDIMAASQTIPGAIAVNASAMIGYRRQGTAGAIAAAAGMMLPPFLLVLGIGVGFAAIRSDAKIQAALEGIRPAVVALIAYAGYRMRKAARLDWASFFLMLATGVVLLMQWLSPALVILLGAAVGTGVVAVRMKLGYTTMPLPSTGRNGQDDTFFGDGI
ncbi:chromate transporter [Paenibacillus koleovorans]|uniref:chromate transporter n=1 Tax=Paenibacillus koleovorans TaxID=121608 RepID=UPI0013E2F0E5|nr:chromate transporter [Paenibacillus koleovorans]